RTDEGPGRHEAHPGADRSRGASDTDEPADVASGPGLYNRQAVQVGVATSLAIVAGELISSARWYWAVIAAFIVFAGTSSRGDVLSRGWARVIGTAGGLVAGMLLAFLVGGNVVASLVLLFACVFLALYLVRISQAMMAFWITAVLALLYGVIGQFSVGTLVLRLEETVVGGVLGMLAAYLVLPTRSRTAFGEALDDVLTSTADGVAAVVDRVLGRPGEDPLEIARQLDTQLGTVRARARPLEHPVARRPLRRGVRHTVRVLGGMDHYVRNLAVTVRALNAPAWASTLDPAAQRVRQNLDALRRILLRGYGPRHGGDRDPPPRIESAEELIDAAEAAASAGPTRDRTALLAVARMLRRIDQLAGGLARELTGGPWSEPDPEPARGGTSGNRVGPATPGTEGGGR
ncbi:MAG: FUSC family protein, partial [Actinomycetota bacterium]|nr:FUSC family protein [Actinomycetota bacterium]